MPPALAFALLMLGASLLPGFAAAEVYTWTDEQGRVHMTDDLSRVPAAYRKQVSGSALDEIPRPREWNDVETVKPPPDATTQSAKGKAAPAPRIYVLRVERAGHSLRVSAELDGRIFAPFVVDTGAMINTIPRWVVAELGIAIDDDTPGTLVRGISGQPMFVPVITVGSVRLGGAEVEDVEMAVLETQNYGLLGMPFFNHFKVSTDPLKGTLTLEEIDIDSADGIYGGQNESSWRADFAFVRYMLEQIERYRAEIPDEMTEYAHKLDRIQEYWERQLDQLELKASRAGVPRAWRE